MLSLAVVSLFISLFISLFNQNLQHFPAPFSALNIRLFTPNRFGWKQARATACGRREPFLRQEPCVDRPD